MDSLAQRGAPDGISLMDTVSAAEWSQRVDLAACYRLVAKCGWTDLTETHITAAVPEEPHTFLINPYPVFFEHINASNLVKVHTDGRILSETHFRINKPGFNIHSAIHIGRPDVQCIIHTHTVAGMAVSSLDCGLLPITQHALVFHGRLGYHEYEGVADDPEERVRLVHDLGKNCAIILRNHGLLTVGTSIANAFKMMYYLEKSCQAQLAAMAAVGGRALTLPSPAVCDRTADQIAQLQNFGAEDWPGHLINLDKIDTSYRR